MFVILVLIVLVHAVLSCRWCYPHRVVAIAIPSLIVVDARPCRHHMLRCYRVFIDHQQARRVSVRVRRRISPNVR
jgi:hypothetical protein